MVIAKDLLQKNFWQETKWVIYSTVRCFVKVSTEKESSERKKTTYNIIATYTVERYVVITAACSSYQLEARWASCWFSSRRCLCSLEAAIDANHLIYCRLRSRSCPRQSEKKSFCSFGINLVQSENIPYVEVSPVFPELFINFLLLFLCT